MNMAHPAMVRQIMEEVEVGRIKMGMIEYWSDPVGNKRRLVRVEVVVYEEEDVYGGDAGGLAPRND